MAAAKAELELQTALLNTGLVQPVETKGRGGKVEVLCRQVLGQERAWLLVVDELLKAFEVITNPVGTFHICRRYVRKGGRLVFGWHLGLDMPTSKALGAAVVAVVAVLLKARPELTPVEDEVPSRPPAVQSAVPQRSRALAPGQHPKRLPPQPRPPGAPARLDPEAGRRVDTIRVVKREIDEGTGRMVVVEEMPLPHVYRDLNKPAHRDGRGAKFSGTGGGNA